MILGFTLVLSKRKEIDLKKLEEAYKEDEKNETDDWHEDTYDWKEEMNKKRPKKKIKPGDIAASGPVLNMNNNMGVKMYTVTLKHGFCGREKCTFKESEEVSRRYRNFLGNGAIQVVPYALGIGNLLFVDSDAHFSEVHAFLMEQPEVYRMTVDGQHFYPPDTILNPKIERPPELERRFKRKVKKTKKTKKKSKKKKGKKKKGKKTKDSKEQKAKSEL